MRQHPQLGNRSVSFARATRGVPILCRFGTKSVEAAFIFYLCPRAPVSFISWACISYLLASPFFSHEFSKKVRKERFAREFSERVHKESPEREFLKRVPKESS